MGKAISIIKNNKTIFITIILILLLVIGTIIIQRSYSLDSNVSSKEASYKTRNLYRNQWFTSDSAMSNTVLSESATGTSNVTFGGGPGGSTLAGFANSAITVPSIATVLEATQSNSNTLYAIYKFNIKYEKGSNVTSIGKTNDTCNVTSTDESCDVTLPSITAASGYNSVGWSLENGATTGTAAESSYTVDSNNITLYANAKNGVAPSCDISVTNNVAASQTATLHCTSTESIVKYYWGTKASPTASDYTSISGTSTLNESKSITDAGTYYLLAEDASGNTSTAVSKKVYKTTFNMTGGTVSPSSVITLSGNSFKLPTPTAASNYTLNGNWYTDSGLTAGAKAYEINYTPSSSVTLYSNAVETYTVTYTTSNSSKGTVSGTTSERVTKNSNPKVTVTVNPTSNYDFIGWTSNSKVTLKNGTEIAAGDMISSTNIVNVKVTSNLTFSAQFELKSHKFGTCYWDVTNGKLSIYATNGTCTLGTTSPNNLPWKEYANSITSIEVGEGVIANANSSYLFSNLPNVVTIDMSNLDTSNVTNMSHMFENDAKLTTIILPDPFDTSKVTNITDMFKGCDSLDSEDINNVDFSNSSIPKPTIVDQTPTINLDADETDRTIKITPPSGGSGMYEYEIISGDSRITIVDGELVLPDTLAPGTYPVVVKITDVVTGETINVTYTIVIGEKYEVTYRTSDSNKGTVSGTTNEEVANGKNPKAEVTVTSSPSYEFVGWTADKNVSLIGDRSIDAGDIINDNNVRDIIVSSDLALTAQFEEISHKIGTCYWKVENGKLSIYAADGSTCKLDKVNPDNLPWKNFVNDITSVEIGEGVIANEDSSYLFSNLPNVTTINLTNLDTTGVTDMSHMFENDAKVTTIIFPDEFVTSSVTDINSMFKGCSSLEELDLSSFDTSNVTDMSSLFEDCSSLTRVDLSSFDTSNVENMDKMFYGCNNLEEIIINPDTFTLDNVNSIDDMFTGCDKLDNNDYNNFDFSNNDNIQEPTFDNPTPHVNLDADDTDKSITIVPPTGGSGVYTYEIGNVQPPTGGITIEGDKIIISDDIPEGTYTVVVRVTDEVTGEVTEVTYTIKIEQGAISDPNTPVISSDYTSSVYKARDITLRCNTSTTYNNGTVIDYYFGSSNNENTAPTSWTKSNSKTYTIPENEAVGIKYYYCRVIATKNSKSSNPVISSALPISITNATLTFNTNGGTIKGTSPLYVRTGESAFYRGLYEKINTIEAPTAYKSGYTFNGWYTASTGGTKVINSKKEVLNAPGYVESNKWVLTEHKTLYAQYTKNNAPDEKTPNVTYNGKTSNFVGFLTAYKTVSLYWAKVDDAQGYQICYKKSSDKKYTCNDKGSLESVMLKAGTKYNFKLSPYRKVNNKLIVSPNSRIISIYTLDKVKGLKVQKKNSTKVKVSFKKVNGVSGYKIYTSTKKNKGYKLVKVVSKSRTSANVTIKSNKKLYYKVRAYKIDNGKRIYAPLSDAKSFRLK